MPQEKYECEICHQVWRLFTDPNFDDEIELGTFQEATSTECCLHGPLVRAFEAYTGDFGDRGGTSVTFFGDSRGGAVALTCLVDRGASMTWDLTLAARGGSATSLPTHLGRILDPAWADLDMVMRWKEACLATHGAACDNPMKTGYTQPDYLIDAERKCLVAGRDVEGRYIALSYLWGQHRQVVFGARARAALFEPQSLNRPDIQAMISPIINHAIQLTGRLGERYLWVDALCIDQNDEEHTRRQLQAMAVIYARAALTIINAEGDSQVGIPGLKGISGPREQRQTIFPFGDEQICVRNNGSCSVSGNEEYYTRGWTY